MNYTRPRTKICLEFAINNLHISANTDWLRHYVARKTKTSVAKIVESIRKEFKNMIEDADWLDEITREAALLKLHKMVSLVGYPDELFDDEILIKHYENITVDEAKLFENVLELNKFHLYTAFKDLHKPIEKADWKSHSRVAVINAFYTPLENTIREGILKLIKAK